ncbi:MAG TPA: hypothetical protein VJV05_05170 [Pyrinomonadaceae bacterium]|nr:hypothetical protein [Pyrinomonadaceae bacterium]
MLKQLFPAATILFTLATVVVAQAPPVETPACNEEFARFLVDQQVSESRSVEQTDKRIRILIRAAEFLWKYDELTARGYFTEAFKVASDNFKEKGFERVEQKGVTQILPDHRFEVIRAISAKDSEWAKKLIEQVLKEYEKAASERKDEFDRARELQDIIRVAQEAIKTNPELSRALFRRAMAYPPDFHWFYVLYSIAEDNRPFSDSLYSELLTAYPNASPRRLLFLSGYPFASGRSLGPDRNNFASSVPEGLTPNREFQRRFIEMYIRRAISFASDPQNLALPPEEYRLPEPIYLISALTQLEPIVIQQFPQLLQAHAEAKARVNGMLTEQMRSDLDKREKQSEEMGRGFDERLKAVEDADAEGKLTDQMIVGLITGGEMKKTEEQFKKIEPWLEKIKQESTRTETNNYYWFVRAKLAVKEYRISEAERFSRKIPEVESRAILFFDIATEQLKNANDAATVYSTLRDVGRLVEQSEPTVEKARVLLALTNQYIKVNPVFAIQELSGAVTVINRLENPTAVMNTAVQRQIRGKNFSFFTTFTLPGQNLEGTFKAISKDNFEMSLSNAKSLEDKYLRTLAVLAVAQNCVDKIKKAPPKKATPKN